MSSRTVDSTGEGTAVPVVAVVGKGDSGKTTFVERLVRTLSQRGVRVATVKHHVHDYDIDVPGKDSWRHARAGSIAAMVSSPNKFSLVRDVQQELTLAQLAQTAADCGCDILIAEGYKTSSGNRIEVSRLARSAEPLSGPGEVLAFVTDNPELSQMGAPTFALDDASGVADFVQERFLGDA